ncbi:hypothetical protein PPMP20_11935 [Paraburkholderia phymatum]|uniref:Uncharacterized protein n=1 Tax=Paraburkholderia phymatum (strain DSM 17167 / CIP 108236 / LMG 21445 / STM815) TaxID=391038 RepID=B2JFW5_PARP8|nr:hypothetical protein [Paraburkholderia phymatum]ACC71590.1 conserved hypothetical protein [Paraburkholderia phymatum STM815]
MDTIRFNYTDLPIGERAAFELVCARHGFAPTHFDISASDDPDDNSHQSRLLTIRRGGWAQSYHEDTAGHWVRQFETDLNCRFFK